MPTLASERWPRSSSWSTCPTSSCEWFSLVSSSISIRADLVPRPFGSSSNPYLVVDKLDWIQCRYLLIQRTTTYSTTSETTGSGEEPVGDSRSRLTRPIALDPMHPPVLSGTKISIPDVTPKLEAMDRKLAGTEEEL
jgi:hypothetical protein